MLFRSHDLKSPFVSMMGFSELLLMNFHKYNLEKIEHFVKIINSAAEQAYKLLENLLDWSRTQTDSIRFAPSQINLAEILNDKIKLYENVANSKNISIIKHCDEQILCTADEDMISSILRNLLSNAIKFTPPSGSVTINCCVDKEKVNISVADSGVGMTEEQIRKIISKNSFYSTPGTDNEKGHGLGLTICQEFIYQHNGEFKIESNLGEGSTFMFTIPLISK